MEKAASDLDAAYTENSQYAERERKSLALLQSEVPLSTTEEADWTGWEFKFSLAQFGVPIGTLQALIGSGDLGLVRSEEPRATLITELAAINTDQSWIDQVSSQALPMGMEGMFEMEVLRRQADGEGISLDALRDSPRLSTSYLNQINLLEDILTSMRRMMVSVDKIHMAVETEIEQRGG